MLCWCVDWHTVVYICCKQHIPSLNACGTPAVGAFIKNIHGLLNTLGMIPMLHESAIPSNISNLAVISKLHIHNVPCQFSDMSHTVRRLPVRRLPLSGNGTDRRTAAERQLCTNSTHHQARSSDIVTISNCCTCPLLA